MIRTIYTGYKIRIEGEGEFTVTGSGKIRKNYFYRLVDSGGNCASINRDVLMAMQADGTATITA